DRSILPAREEKRRREAPGQSEDGDHLRAMTPRERAAGRGHGRHEEERERRRDQAVEGARGPERGVERDRTRAGDRVARAAVPAPKNPVGSDDAPDADERAGHDAHDRRDEAVLDRVLEEEKPGEGERDAAEHGGPADTEPALPVDLYRRLAGRRGRWQRTAW